MSNSRKNEFYEKTQIISKVSSIKITNKKK